MKRAIAMALCALGAGCGEPTQASDVFIAMDRDFADFLRWRRVDLGAISLAGHPPGTRVAFVNRALDATDSRYPLGSIIVKAITNNSEDTDRWAVIAMVKRGGGFNREGATDWEFFTLRTQGGVVSIANRGIAPRSDGDGDPYGATDEIGCNACHGTPDARAVDSVLTPELRPPAATP